MSDHSAANSAGDLYTGKKIHQHIAEESVDLRASDYYEGSEHAYTQSVQLCGTLSSANMTTQANHACSTANDLIASTRHLQSLAGPDRLPLLASNNDRGHAPQNAQAQHPWARRPLNLVLPPHLLDPGSFLIPELADKIDRALNRRYRVRMKPAVRPDTDATIPLVEADWQNRVAELKGAMMNTEGTSDKRGSFEYNMFHEPAFDLEDIRATCFAVFAAFLDRCKNGYRNPDARDSSNKAIRPKMPGPKSTIDNSADRDGDCQTRYQNILHALKTNKRICRDVLYEDSKIFEFVNAPLGFLMAKEGNRKCNDRRADQNRQLYLENTTLKGRVVAPPVTAPRITQEHASARQVKAPQSLPVPILQPGSGATPPSGGIAMAQAHNQRFHNAYQPAHDLPRPQSRIQHLPQPGARHHHNVISRLAYNAQISRPNLHHNPLYGNTEYQAGGHPQMHIPPGMNALYDPQGGQYGGFSNGLPMARHALAQEVPFNASMPQPQASNDQAPQLYHPVAVHATQHNYPLKMLLEGFEDGPPTAATIPAFNDTPSPPLNPRKFADAQNEDNISQWSDAQTYVGEKSEERPSLQESKFTTTTVTGSNASIDDKASNLQIGYQSSPTTVTSALAGTSTTTNSRPVSLDPSEYSELQTNLQLSDQDPPVASEPSPCAPSRAPSSQLLSTILATPSTPSKKRGREVDDDFERTDEVKRLRMDMVPTTNNTQTYTGTSPPSYEPSEDTNAFPLPEMYGDANVDPSMPEFDPEDLFCQDALLSSNGGSMDASLQHDQIKGQSMTQEFGMPQLENETSSDDIGDFLQQIREGPDVHCANATPQLGTQTSIEESLFEDKYDDEEFDYVDTPEFKAYVAMNLRGEEGGSRM